MINIEKKIEELKQELLNSGEITLNNPKKGTSTITKIDCKVHYTRGKSNISLSVDLIVKTYNEFNGKKCSSKDLKDFDNQYKNKPCNAIFFLMLMEKLLGCKIEKEKNGGCFINL